MKIVTSFLLLAIHLCCSSQTANLNLNKKTKSISSSYEKKLQQLNTNCKAIKCPTKEEPVCVKLKNRKVYGPKDVFIVVINKCEIEYIKCHKGLEAIVVPMQNCVHNKPAAENRALSSKKRAKRSPGIGKKTFRKHMSQNKINYKSLYFGFNKKKDYIKALRRSAEEYADFKKLRDDVDNKTSLEGTVLKSQSNENNNNMLQKTQDIVGDKDTKEVTQVNHKGDNSEALLDDEHNMDSKKTLAKEEVLEHDNEKHNIDSAEKVTPNDVEKKSEEMEQDDHVNNEAHVLEGEFENSKKDSQKSVEQSPSVPSKNVQKNVEDNSANNKADSNISQNQSEVNTGLKSAENDEKETYENVHKSNKNNRGTGDSAVDDVIKNNNSGSNDEDPSMKDDIVIKSRQLDYEEVDKVQYQKDCPSVCPARDVMLCARCKEGVYRTFLSVCHLRMFNCKHPEEKLELVSRKPCILSAPFLYDLPQSRGRVGEPDDDDVVLKYIRCREQGHSGCNIESNNDDAS